MASAYLHPVLPIPRNRRFDAVAQTLVGTHPDVKVEVDESSVRIVHVGVLSMTSVILYRLGPHNLPLVSPPFFRGLIAVGEDMYRHNLVRRPH
ncbi:hypothetical protein L226DRAFT_340059 [Lentinus tigrinus ALCF2SS1-7]|uniref:uncharacterized protein n=1 Tax=Lentinus tigrinus ALCF2SS1-7 TaxID=1328758 RepID=UPI00116608A0|nr:hypothetical protein L226DRAFT_340059 [Lentinus tigrinus ALCF2SS1-7]